MRVAGDHQGQAYGGFHRLGSHPAACSGAGTGRPEFQTGIQVSKDRLAKSARIDKQEFELVWYWNKEGLLSAVG